LSFLLLKMMICLSSFYMSSSSSQFLVFQLNLQLIFLAFGAIFLFLPLAFQVVLKSRLCFGQHLRPGHLVH
jgi:hypothetical protein